MDTNLSSTTTTTMKTGVPNYSVSAKILDVAGDQKETYWENSNWPTYLGYLKTIPEYRNAIRSLSIWTCGKGWEADIHTSNILRLIVGWGEDSFDSILQDMIVVKKTNGDAYAEVIRDEDSGTIINLKKLDPSTVRHVVNPKGLLIGYDVKNANGTWQRMETKEIFHICNDRIANEIHGVSVLESCKWVIDWKNEMLSDLRRVMHRATIRVLYIDADDTTKLSLVKTQYQDAIKNGELMIIPAKKGESEFQELNIPPTEAWMTVIRYADNYFYEILGVPKITTGGTQDYTEASSKVGYLTFEQPYMTEQRLLEQDILNQLGLEVKFIRPVSLKEDMVSSEAANTGQVGFQPNEMQTGMTRTE